MSYRCQDGLILMALRPVKYVLFSAFNQVIEHEDRKKGV